MTNSDRDRGILTPNDREYLRGERDEPYQSDAAEYNKRHHIRTRIKNSLLDFPLLLNDLENSDREKMTKDMAGWPHKVVLGGGRACVPLADMIGFVWLLCDDESEFEATVREGVMRAVQSQGKPVARVTADIEVDRPSRIVADEILNKAAAGEYGSLDLGEQLWLTRALIATDSLPHEKIVEQLRSSDYPPVHGEADDLIAGGASDLDLDS